MNPHHSFKSHWWSKTIIGVVFGLFLSYGIVAMFAWFGPHGIEGTDKVQFNMWLISPIWLTVLSLVYLFANRRSAILYLGGANCFIYGVYFLLRSVL